MKLENKNIVLTGGSSGIGLDLLRLIGPSNTVINLSRRAPPPRVSDSVRDCIHFETDLADQASVRAAVAEINALYPEGVDGLINCAAIQYTPKITDTAFSQRSIAREIQVNLTSPIELIAGLIGPMIDREDAFIMNINSGLGIVPKRESAVYCATKAGLDSFTRGLRAQTSQSQLAILQAFMPLVDTPMTEGRGVGKMTSQAAARQIILGIEKGIPDHDIGKVKFLRLINRIAPSLAIRIMQGGN